MDRTVDISDKVLITREGLDNLLQLLAADGHQVIGPSISDDAITYDEIEGIADLPSGWTDQQEAGRYRLERRDDEALFGYTVGPHSWKQFLHPPRETLWSVQKTADGLNVTSGDAEVPKYAFVGVRACEISAVAIQDKVFIEGPFIDRPYERRRREAFIVAVNCSKAGNTCFCVSMDTGPKVRAGFDLALTELIDGGRHDFLVEIGSDAGLDAIKRVAHVGAAEADVADAEAVSRNTVQHMGRKLDVDGLKELLQDNLLHPQWDKVAERCLSCGNCTMVCPTCFCTTVTDHSDLSGMNAQRDREWDSCFTMDFSYIHGGSVRKTTASRYRQWMTHKLSSWFDQFGTSGCVGCGRCVTWCPVGIDITEEASIIRATSLTAKQEDGHGGD